MVRPANIGDTAAYGIPANNEDLMVYFLIGADTEIGKGLNFRTVKQHMV